MAADRLVTRSFTTRRVIVVPAARWPRVCADPRCHHAQCRHLRELTLRRCVRCELPVAPGQRVIEFLKGGHLVSVEHQRCPVH